MEFTLALNTSVVGANIIKQRKEKEESKEKGRKEWKEQEEKER